MENIDVQNLAARLADFLQKDDKKSSDFLQSGLEKLHQRLDNIESQIVFQKSKIENQKPNSNHSSQEKFFNLKELAVETTDGLKDEKACPFEPAGKPCDHCAMCNSRGF